MTQHIIFEAGRAVIDGGSFAPADRLPDGERTDAARFLAASVEWRRLAAAISGAANSGGKKEFSQAERKRRAARLAAVRSRRWPE